jgi:Ca2+-binding EF-hand superfamily protein
VTNFLAQKEIEEWITPGSNAHVEDEAKHLIEQADTDEDGKLTSDEIVSQYDLFVGSQVTDYGSLLQSHDEL